MDFNLTTIFEEFYHTRFFVIICLSLFTILFSLRLDNVLKVSYWIIFIPLWIWKLTALIGMIVGIVVWIRISRRRFDQDMLIQFKSMLISFTTNLFLFSFELILCEKLETNRQIAWSICFIPLYILSIVSIATAIWSIRFDRSYEIEIFCSLNILQFVFISLRLDYTITWSWILVLIPIWIIMSIGFIILIYIIILTAIITRNSSNSLINHHLQQTSNQRSKQHKWSNVIFYTLFLVSLLTFEILLVNKLDYEMSSSNLIQHIQNFINLQNQQYNHISHFTLSSLYSNNNNNNIKSNLINTSSLTSSSSSSSSSKHPTLSFFLITIPLYFSYLSLLILSFNNHTGNVWWFGIRRDFCDLFLDLCPMLKLYGNIQYKTKTDLNFEENNQFNEQTLNLILATTNLNTNNNERLNQNLVINRSNETSLMTFSLVNNNQNLGSSSSNNNNYMSLSILENNSNNVNSANLNNRNSNLENQSAQIVTSESRSTSDKMFISYSSLSKKVEKKEKKMSNKKIAQNNVDQYMKNKFNLDLVQLDLPD